MSNMPPKNVEEIQDSLDEMAMSEASHQMSVDRNDLLEIIAENRRLQGRVSELQQLGTIKEESLRVYRKIRTTFSEDQEKATVEAFAATEARLIGWYGESVKGLAK